MRILIASIFLILFNLTVYSVSLKGFTGLATVPTAFCSQGYSYQKIGPEYFYGYSKTMVFNRIEFGLIKNNDDSETMYHGKMKLMDMTAYTPAIAIGVFDINNPNKKESYYLACSYILSDYGTGIHFGFMSESGYKNILKIRNIDDITPYLDKQDKQNHFFIGLEQSIFPMLSVYGEYSNEIVNIGLKIHPTFNISLDVIQRDIRNDLSLNEKRAYSVSYNMQF